MSVKRDRYYYRGKYIIVFYAKDDETYLHEFDNIIDILDFKKLPHTPQNIKTMQCNIMRALQWRDHKTHCLTGEMMYVYLIDMIKEN